MLKRFLFLFAMAIIAGPILRAQVTNSSMTGSVSTASGEFLVGATITATHIPTGTVYQTIAKQDGLFTIPAMRVGGPYTVKVDFVGQQSKTFNDIVLQLGEAYNLKAVLGIAETELTGVVVTGTTRRGATDKTGMSTTINNRLLSTLPTITRSITDFTRLTPQANGTSFAGRDAKLNNITVDGANLNNNFGLSDDPLPGAGNSPISLDAIEEVSVSISPFDVKQGNFTGGNIAAITRSGTNTFHGTAYTYYNDKKLVGDKVKNGKAVNSVGKTNIYGASIGGPIIKNRLFFFLNAEKEVKPPSAGITYTPTGGSGQGNISATPVDSLKRVDTYLRSLGYDPGVYDNFPAFRNENRKFLAKIDWNLSSKNKITLKYSDFKGTQDFQPSQSGNVGGTQAGITYGPKFSPTALSFSSVNYVQEDIVKSGAFEVNTSFNSRFSNQFLATYTQIKSDKTHEGALFPFIDILGATTGDVRNYISVGNEPFNGNNNKVLNNIMTITDNFTFYAGKHNLTAGLSYEYQKVGNMFMRGATGYYLFRSVNDFVTNRAPIKFANTYSLIPGEDAVFSAELRIGQAAAYVQDEWNVNPNFKITAGIRGDMPIYLEQPLENPANTALTFRSIDGSPIKLNTGQFPKEQILLSPRVGFRWDVNGDKRMILRGGTGIFTGRIPFVYLTNIPTNSGMYQYSANVNTTLPGVNLNNYLFSPDPNAYNPNYNKNLPANLFPTTAGTVASADFVVTNRDYKFAQIFRTNFGVDKALGKTWRLTLEALFTKDLNATYMYNANQKATDATVTTGGYTRTAFSANTNAARRVNPSITNAIVLDNTKRGHSFVFTTQLAKTFTRGLYGSIAYNYTFSQDVTANPGSQASSVWNANPTSNTLNDFELANSAFANPHRVVGNISYRAQYVKHLATTLSLFYEGRNGGRYSYVYNGDLNYDGFSQDLMYVPTDARNASEIVFRNNVVYGTGPTAVTYTAAQQAEIFENYINQDPYLKKHRGQVTERYGAKYPWYDRVDAKLVQEIFSNIGKNRHSIEVSADVYNVLNLVNKNWGIRKMYTIPNPLKVETITNGIPTFSLTAYNNAPIDRTFIDNVSTNTTWAMQLGLRYRF